jgi:hypothetical protein
MQTVGALVRAWADRAEGRAGSLLEPTLERVQQAEQRRGRHASLGLALAAALAFALPWAQEARPPLQAGLMARPLIADSAAIERLEAGDTQARVFVVGRSGTPVVWLADDALEDDGAAEQDPG